MLLSIAVVGTMAFTYFYFRLTGRMHGRFEGSDTYSVEESLPYIGAGQIWYRRSDPFAPFINKEEEPIRILEYRANAYDGWVRFMVDGELRIERVSELVTEYMLDEFNDMGEAAFFVDVQPDLEVEPEEPPSIPSKSVVSIKGKDYILSPVR